MSDLTTNTSTQDEVVTLDALRAAAKAISPPAPRIYWDEESRLRSKLNNEHARAEFWRLAYRWRGAEVSLYYRGDITDHDISDAEAIIAEVEART